MSYEETLSVELSRYMDRCEQLEENLEGARTRWQAAEHVLRHIIGAGPCNDPNCLAFSDARDYLAGREEE